MRITGKESKVAFGAMTLVIALLATLAIMPLKYSAAQNATTPTMGEIMSERVKEKIAQFKTNHPELGALADRMQMMNVTQVANEVEVLLDFGKEMVTTMRNLSGNMTTR
jgi:hypothetical protein